MESMENEPYVHQYGRGEWGAGEDVSLDGISSVDEAEVVDEVPAESSPLGDSIEVGDSIGFVDFAGSPVEGEVLSVSLSEDGTYTMSVRTGTNEDAQAITQDITIGQTTLIDKSTFDKLPKVGDRAVFKHGGRSDVGTVEKVHYKGGKFVAQMSPGVRGEDAGPDPDAKLYSKKASNLIMPGDRVWVDVDGGYQVPAEVTSVTDDGEVEIESQNGDSHIVSLKEFSQNCRKDSQVSSTARKRLDQLPKRGDPIIYPGADGKNVTGVVAGGAIQGGKVRLPVQSGENGEVINPSQGMMKVGDTVWLVHDDNTTERVEIAGIGEDGVEILKEGAEDTETVSADSLTTRRTLSQMKASGIESAAPKAQAAAERVMQVLDSKRDDPQVQAMVQSLLKGATPALGKLGRGIGAAPMMLANLSVMFFLCLLFPPLAGDAMKKSDEYLKEMHRWIQGKDIQPMSKDSMMQQLLEAQKESKKADTLADVAGDAAKGSTRAAATGAASADLDDEDSQEEEVGTPAAPPVAGSAPTAAAVPPVTYGLAPPDSGAAGSGLPPMAAAAVATADAADDLFDID